MKIRFWLKFYFKIFVLGIITGLIFSQCFPDDVYMAESRPISPVNYQPEVFPFPTLSDYNFFTDELKNLEPVYGVLPYDLISTLFSDYASKKRFIWMPSEVKATYSTDSSIMNFPIGTMLIKNFYYEKMLPENAQKILETRLMLKKETGWEFANYVWNEEQTEAYFTLEGSNVNISFINNATQFSTNYRIPSEAECHTCHKSSEVNIPIGVKPQNLNKNYNYQTENKNQLQYWKDFGYLDDFPSEINSVINWKDQTKPVKERIRSYLDINCAHCHTAGGHCDYTAMRFSFQETLQNSNLGICVPSDQSIPSYNYIIEAGNAQRSAISYRMHSVNPAQMMPLMGRTLVHQEAVALIDEWINSLSQSCQ